MIWCTLYSIFIQTTPAPLLGLQHTANVPSFADVSLTTWKKGIKVLRDREWLKHFIFTKASFYIFTAGYLVRFQQWEITEIEKDQPLTMNNWQTEEVRVKNDFSFWTEKKSQGGCRRNWRRKNWVSTGNQTQDRTLSLNHHHCHNFFKSAKTSIYITLSFKGKRDLLYLYHLGLV